MKPPELVSATPEEIDELLALAKATFPAKSYQLLEGVLGTFVYVMGALQNAKTSLKRFRQMLFGARTESKSNLFKTPGVARAADEAALAGTPPPTPGERSENPPAPPVTPGHGRNGAQAYSNSPV
ncbi:MAG TPA: hypothetical protein PK441_12705, partial [Burkholderiaceae bacterium]|nr:hypothetical protein [Burkholderiaceae bacterium]